MRSRGAYGSVFKVFLPQKANNAPFTVTDPNMARDFIYVDDVVEAFIMAADLYPHDVLFTTQSPKTWDTPAPVYDEVYNIGSGQPTLIGDMLRRLGARITQGETFCHGDDVVMIPKRPGEPDVTWADIGKAERHLGWQPRVFFNEGMDIMLRNVNEWKDETVWTKESIERQTEIWYTYLGPRQ
jgi:UDP-glucose 4-epimerase